MCCIDDGQKSDALGIHWVLSVTWAMMLAEIHLDIAHCTGTLGRCEGRQTDVYLGSMTGLTQSLPCDVSHGHTASATKPLHPALFF